VVTIVPAIIPKSFDDLKEKVGLIYTSVDLVQVDMCDGKFVSNKSWPFVEDHGEFRDLVKEKSGLPHWEEIEYEIHLMTDTPSDEVADWVRAGAGGVIVHIETGSDALEDIIEEWGHTVQIGIAFKPQTPISKLTPFLEKVKMIQIMGNDRIGMQGQKLDSIVYEKIRELRLMAPEHTIAVDIGVNEETAPLLVKAGADKLIIGSAIMDKDMPGEAIKKFQKLTE